MGRRRPARPFLYRDGATRSLGGFGGFGREGRANAVNNVGQIVGYCCLRGDEAPRAFLWENGVLRNLNERTANLDGWLLTEATGINDAGLIIANGQRNGAYRAFLLTPETVAEPVLAITGRKGIVTRAGRRRVTGTTTGDVSAVVFYRNGHSVAHPIRRSAAGWQFTPALRPGRNVFVVEARGYAGRAFEKIVIRRR